MSLCPSQLFRHGDRSPIRAYPTDPYQEKDWPQGFGQLSQVHSIKLTGLVTFKASVASWNTVLHCHLFFSLCSQVGMRQHLELGHYLRNRYKGFLNETYHRNEVEAPWDA